MVKAVSEEMVKKEEEEEMGREKEFARQIVVVVRQSPTLKTLKSESRRIETENQFSVAQ